MIVVSFLERQIVPAYAAGDSWMPKGTRLNTLQPAPKT